MLRLVTLVLMERGGSVACHGVSGWRLGRTTAGKSFYGVNLFRAFSLAEGGDDGDDFLLKALRRRRKLLVGGCRPPPRRRRVVFQAEGEGLPDPRRSRSQWEADSVAALGEAVHGDPAGI